MSLGEAQQRYNKKIKKSSAKTVSSTVNPITKKYKAYLFEEGMYNALKAILDCLFTLNPNQRSRSKTFNLLKDTLIRERHWKNAPRGNPKGNSKRLYPKEESDYCDEEYF